MGFRVRVVALTAALTLAAGCAGTVTGQAIRDPAQSPITPSAVPDEDPPSTQTSTPEPSQPPDIEPTPPETPVDPAAEQPGPVTPDENSTEPADDQVGMIGDVEIPTLKVRGATDSVIDEIAIAALADLFDFYSQALPDEFGQDYQPPKNLVSYDSRTRHKSICDIDVYDFANAFYAADCNTVAWDRGVLLAEMYESIGPLAPAVVIAHEIGHDVQFQLGMPWDAPTLLLEQQADCYTGAYWRWVYDGNSKYFVFNQTEGMRQLLSSVLAVKDPPMTPSDVAIYGVEDNHGNGFDRTFATTLGYTAGVARCHEIDQAEVDARLQEFPFDSDQPYQYGNLDITAETLTNILAVADDYFTRAQPGYISPRLVQSAQVPLCDGQPSPTPVSYCPTANTVTYDLAALQKIGTPTEGWDSPNGDFSAFILLVSRYALAAQHAGFAPVTGTEAGLLSLCYTGTWATWFRLPRGGYQLSPNDLDKAIYEILSSPVAGSDVNGVTDATLIERMQAFGFGVTHSMPECFDAYLQ